MKYDPINHLYYDHTPEEWAELQGNVGVSLPASIAARLVKRCSEKSPETSEAAPDSTEQLEERIHPRIRERRFWVAYCRWMRLRYRGVDHD